jgi:hypothetical protein
VVREAAGGPAHEKVVVHRQVPTAIGFLDDRHRRDHSLAISDDLAALTAALAGRDEPSGRAGPTAGEDQRW